MIYVLPPHALVGRKSWAERMAAGELGFDVNVAALRLDATLERHAQDMHDLHFGGRSQGRDGGRLAGAAPKGSGKGFATMSCTKCGRKGHTAEYCRGEQCWM